MKKKVNLFQKKSPIQSQRYRALSTFKKKNKKVVEQAVNLIPQKLVLKLFNLVQ
jgi:hypothetical protein